MQNLKPADFLSALEKINPDIKCPLCGNNDFFILSGESGVHNLGVKVLESIAGALLPSEYSHNFHAMSCSKCAHTLFFNRQVLESILEGKQK